MRDIFEEIKSRVRLGEYLTSNYGLDFKRNMALCPLHKDKKTRSFHLINDERWYCFGGCKGGDIIEFVQKRHNLPLMDAVKQVAQSVGVKMDANTEKRIKKFKELRDRTQTMLDRASIELNEDMAADLYLQSRGLTSEAVKFFGLGYRPDIHGISIPINDRFGRLVGYSVRLLADDADPKYKNSYEDEYGLFKKKEILYNLGSCRTEVKERVYICEGYFDVHAMWMLGYKNTIGICQAIMTKEQAGVLHEAMTPETEIVFVPDTDAPGVEALLKNVKLCRAYSKERPIRVAFLKEDMKDVSEALVKKGEDWTKSVIDYHQPAEIVLLEQSFRAEPDRAKQYQLTYPILQAVSPLLRDDCLDFLCKQWGKDKKLLASYFGVEVKEATADAFCGPFEMADAYAEYVTNVHKHGVKFNMPGFDRLIRRIAPGEVAYFQARTSVGKTALLINLLGKLSMQNIPVLFFSLEQQKEQIFERMVQIANAMTSFDIERFTYNKDPRMSDAHNNYYQMFKNVHVCDKGSLTLKQIMEHIYRFSAIHTFPHVVAIDYFGYIDTGTDNIYEGASKLAKGIKSAAKELNNCWVVLHQLSRVGGTGGEPVTLDMGRDSGVIEESADQVIGCWRPELAKNLEEAERIRLEGENIMEAAVLKNRSGPTGGIKLSFDRKTLRISDYQANQQAQTHVAEEPKAGVEQMNLDGYTQDPEATSGE